MNSGYKIIYDEIAIKILKKMDKQVAKRIVNWLYERLNDCQNPRLWGKPLTGNLGEFWRYRIGNYRVICKIEDHKLKILVLELDHRSNVYD